MDLENTQPSITAKSQHLADFQIRLMQRLQASSADGGDIATWLAIKVGDFRYLIPLIEAGEVFSLSPEIQIEKIAHTQEWFLGVSNLRGAPYAIVDLAGWLGIREQGKKEDLLHEGKGVLITFDESLQISCALLVDEVLGLRSDSDWEELSQVPHKEGDAATELYSDKLGNIWSTLLLSDLVCDEHFLAIEK